MLDRLLHPFELFAASYLATLLVAVGCALLGVFVALRRIVFVGAALAEVSAAGIAVALAASGGLGLDRHGSDLAVTAGSVAFSLAGTVLLAWAGGERRITREGLVAVGFAAGAAAAVLVVWKSAAELEHVKNILSGSSLYVTDAQLAILAVAFAALALVHAALHKEIVFCSFDPLTARTLGLPVRAVDATLLGTIGLAIAVSLPLVGVLPVFGFLTVPALSGLLLGGTLPRAFVHAAAHAAVASAAGLVAADAIDLPLGPATVAVLLAMLGPSALVARFERLRAPFLAVEVATVVGALALGGFSVHCFLHQHEAHAPHVHDRRPPAAARIEAAHDPGTGSHAVVIHSAVARIEAGDARGVEELVVELASDAPPFDRGEALDALKPIAGQDFGYDPDRDAAGNAEALRRWRDWLAHARGRLRYDPKARTFTVGR